MDIVKHGVSLWRGHLVALPFLVLVIPMVFVLVGMLLGSGAKEIEVEEVGDEEDGDDSEDEVEDEDGGGNSKDDDDDDDDHGDDSEDVEDEDSDYVMVDMADGVDSEAELNGDKPLGQVPDTRQSLFGDGSLLHSGTEEVEQDEVEEEEDGDDSEAEQEDEDDSFLEFLTQVEDSAVDLYIPTAVFFVLLLVCSAIFDLAIFLSSFLYRSLPLAVVSVLVDFLIKMILLCFFPMTFFIFLPSLIPQAHSLDISDTVLVNPAMLCQSAQPAQGLDTHAIAGIFSRFSDAKINIITYPLFNPLIQSFWSSPGDTCRISWRISWLSVRNARRRRGRKRWTA